MRILHLGKLYYPDLGGIESVTRSLAEGAVSKGHKCSVVCFTERASDSIETLAGVSVHRTVSRLTIASQPLSFKYFLLSGRLCREHDVVHLHAPNLLGMLAALIFSRQKLVLHWHSDILNKGLLGKLVKPVEYLCAIKAKVIIATSNAYVGHSSILKTFKKKVSVVPLGTDVNQLRTIHKLRSRKTILAVGRLVEYKGFNYLLKAFAQCEFDADLIIVGSGPEEGNLKLLASQLKIDNLVDFRGSIDNEELSKLFCSSHMFCLPSINKSEAFGVVLLEAMAAGLPIISSDVKGSGMSWVNKHMTSGIKVQPRDIKGLSMALDLLLRNDELRNKLAVGAKNRVNKHFDNEKNVEKTMQLYSNLFL